MLPKLSLLIFTIILSLRSSYQQNCGVKKNVNYLIMNGSNTKKGEWPWYAAVFLKENQGTFICGGTLINRDFVLTAAHCIINYETGYELSPGRIYVKLGVYDLSDRTTQQKHEVLKIFKHSEFEMDKVKSDIALLELQNYAKLDNYVQPICLGQFNSLVGKTGTVVGLGMMRDYSFAKILQSAAMPVVAIINCIMNHRSFGLSADESSLCVGYSRGTSVCNGDSGGGLFFNIGDTWYLGGIVSYGISKEDGTNRCRQDGYAIFVNVQLYLDWIAAKANLKLSSVRPAQSSTGISDCGPGCREFRCHVDPRRCDSNVAHRTAVHHPHPDCAKYYTCKERSNIICEFDCPAGLHFNRNKNVCDWTWSAGCVSAGRQ